ncbi:cytochrome b561 and DOMON domain-containing protein At2g04850 [Selaginella moellendorffii]|nr:cytochrome b561 and DOMON domain-containing protein At2g04850 [Selaginella moellendorffii]|eukprot:XP_002972389.2 cytochrome b561 and DOMON domain-containing protein At2g04850 [Selaginella moellendorffii]
MAYKCRRRHWPLLDLIAIALFCHGAKSEMSSPRQEDRCSTDGLLREFEHCVALGAQGAFLAWNFFAQNQSLDLAFSGESPGWAGWGYNPTGDNMIGSSALIAFGNATGAHLHLYSITSETYTYRSLHPSASNSTPDLQLARTNWIKISGASIQFSARIKFRSNSSRIFHIWTRGTGVNGDSPLPHSVTRSSELRGRGTLDLANGTGVLGKAPSLALKITHGLLCASSWGFLLPLGAIAARYLRRFDPAWFYAHECCQGLGFLLGTAGYGIGLSLGAKSTGIEYTTHRRIGITVFTLGSLQAIAFFLRAKKDHKLRWLWSLYHRTVGYTVIALSIANVFEGLDIFSPERAWRRAYIGVIAGLASMAALLEIARTLKPQLFG